MDLVDKKCIPCSGGVPPLPEGEILKLKKEKVISLLLEQQTPKVK